MEKINIKDTNDEESKGGKMVTMDKKLKEKQEDLNIMNKENRIIIKVM